MLKSKRKHKKKFAVPPPRPSKEPEKKEEDKEIGEDVEMKEGEAMEDINVEIEFIDPKEEYFHALRQYLVNLLDGESFNAGDLADAIIAQVEVGTLVINADQNPDERNLLAFATLLPLALHHKRPSVQSVVKYCLAKAAGKPEAAAFQSIIEKKKVALLINERLVNLPLEPVPPLHKMLKEDWQYAQEMKYEGFDIEYVLYITKVASELGAESGPKRKKGEESSFIYYKFEDAILEDVAECKLVFPSKIALSLSGASNPTEYTMKSNLQYSKMIMLVPFEKYITAQEQFNSIQSPWSKGKRTRLII